MRNFILGVWKRQVQFAMTELITVRIYTPGMWKNEVPFEVLTEEITVVTKIYTMGVNASDLFLRVVTKLITVMKFTHRGCESVRFNSKSHLWEISHMTRVMWMYLTCLQCLMHSVTELITAVEVFTHAMWKSQFQSHSCVRLHSMVKLYSC